MLVDHTRLITTMFLAMYCIGNGAKKESGHYGAKYRTCYLPGNCQLTATSRVMVCICLCLLRRCFLCNIRIIVIYLYRGTSFCCPNHLLFTFYLLSLLFSLFLAFSHYFLLSSSDQSSFTFTHFIICKLP